jgi:aspartate aminotransferase-like enzyme
MFALQEQFRRMESEGYEQRFRRHREMGARVRDWAGRKFGLFAEEGARSETVTCITNTRAIDVSGLILKLADRGFGLGNGYGRLKEKTFRVGHMGDHTVDGIAGLLEAIDAALSESG